MNIESMTIGKRIALGFAVILAILLIIGVFAIYQMNGASTAAGYLSDEYIPELGMISKLQGSVADARVGARSFQFTGEAPRQCSRCPRRCPLVPIHGR